MKSDEIRKRFLDFFENEKRGHAIIPSSSLVPENDPSTLFTTAGMQPLVPYLLGEKHPKGERVANVQKCIRTGDIDEVGDATHLTFFEMLGNWSFGDYFKKDAIKWSYEFLTNKESGLGLNAERLYVTCFEGDENAPKDTKSAEIWKKVGIPESHIYFLGANKNWWSAGDNGPCGPDTEMYYDITEDGLDIKNKEDFLKADKEQKVVEIWNDVFMEYQKQNGKIVGKLPQKNVDTGAGLERMAMVLQGKKNVFETDLFVPMFEKIRALSSSQNTKATRIVADHMKASVFMIADGVLPSNTDRGYILRRLIRRAVRYADLIQFGDNKLSELVNDIVSTYKAVYPEIEKKQKSIASIINEEEDKFRKTLKEGLKQFNWFVGKLGADGQVVEKELPASIAFDLVTTYGFPFELVVEEAKGRGLFVDRYKFNSHMEAHRIKSRKGSEQKFKGGLADTSEKTTMLHTATHLMLGGLRKYLGDHIHQAGSNITTERTRFDFTHQDKVERATLDKVEEYVNESISKKCDVAIVQTPKGEAKANGVEGSFWEKYPEVVNVYTIKAPDGTIYSQELCGGPHVKNTGDIIGKFKIIKEESSSAGIRRIKAVLE
ncbi:MAG: alanine--tRNA ligase [Patescibacteria group bacterium]